MTRNQITEKIISHLTEMLNTPTPSVNADTALVATGLMDSLQILSLIEFVESQFEVKLGDDDLVPANFETPTLVTNLVCQLKGIA